MGKRSQRNTRAKIVTAAWKLFYEQGYENTTVEEILFDEGNESLLKEIRKYPLDYFCFIGRFTQRTRFAGVSCTRHPIR